MSDDQRCEHGITGDDCEECLYDQELTDDQATDDDWPEWETIWKR